MKRLVILAIILCICAGTIFFARSGDKDVRVLPAKTSLISPTLPPVTINQSIVLNIQDSPIRISWAIVSPKDVDFYSNLEERKLSEEIKVNKRCQILVNGGFYSKENTHLGLFIANFETISSTQTNSFLNGFLWIESNNIFVRDNPPDINPRIAIQSGPLLMQEGKPLILAISNDEPNRRIVAAITADNKLIFLAVYHDRSEHQGPLLGKLPEILNQFKKQTGINIADAINMDGGSASVFISNYVRLNEFAHIGSYFCIK